MKTIGIYWEMESGLEPFWPSCCYDDCTHWLDRICHPEVYDDV